LHLISLLVLASFLPVLRRKPGLLLFPAGAPWERNAVSLDEPGASSNVLRLHV